MALEQRRQSCYIQRSPVSQPIIRTLFSHSVHMSAMRLENRRDRSCATYEVIRPDHEHRGAQNILSPQLGWSPPQPAHKEASLGDQLPEEPTIDL